MSMVLAPSLFGGQDGPATGPENLVLGPNEATVRDRYRWADEVSKRSVVG